MQVVEFELEGIGITTVDPTPSPSKEPTPSPTTGQPTMAPTSQCKGQVTWGDPHFRMMAFDNDAVAQFNYQELGWFYYIAPCDLSQFEHFPFFLLSEHVRCYWKGNKKGCIHTNKLVLNTKPDPIIITFNNRDLEVCNYIFCVHIKYILNIYYAYSNIFRLKYQMIYLRLKYQIMH